MALWLLAKALDWPSVCEWRPRRQPVCQSCRASLAGNKVCC